MEEIEDKHEDDDEHKLYKNISMYVSIYGVGFSRFLHHHWLNCQVCIKPTSYQKINFSSYKKARQEWFSKIER